MTETLYEKVLKAINSISNAVKTNPKGSVAIATAMGRSSNVLLHLLLRSNESLPIIFADTGCHHPEILKYAKAFGTNNNSNLLITKQSTRFEQYHDEKIEGFPALGSGLLPQHNMSDCCQALKINPIVEICKKNLYSVVIVGNRINKNNKCGDEQFFQLPKEIMTISPIYNFTDQDITDYISEYNINNPEIYKKGFQAIACYPCTPPIKKKWTRFLNKPKKNQQEAEDDRRLTRRLEDLGYL